MILICQIEHSRKKVKSKNDVFETSWKDFNHCAKKQWIPRTFRQLCFFRWFDLFLFQQFFFTDPFSHQSGKISGNLKSCVSSFGHWVHCLGMLTQDAVSHSKEQKAWISKEFFQWGSWHNPCGNAERNCYLPRQTKLGNDKPKSLTIFYLHSDALCWVALCTWMPHLLDLCGNTNHDSW